MQRSLPATSPHAHYTQVAREHISTLPCPRCPSLFLERQESPWQRLPNSQFFVTSAVALNLLQKVNWFFLTLLLCPLLAKPRRNLWNQNFMTFGWCQDLSRNKDYGRIWRGTRQRLRLLPPLSCASSAPSLKLHPSLLMWLWLEKVAKKWVILLSYSGASYQAKRW